MSDLLSIPGDLYNLVVSILQFLIGVPGMFVDILVTLGTMIFYPFYSLIAIIVADIWLCVNWVLMIIDDFNNIFDEIRNLTVTFADVMGNSVIANMIILGISIVLFIKVYNYVADTEILGFKLPRFGGK